MDMHSLFTAEAATKGRRAETTVKKLAGDDGGAGSEIKTCAKRQHRLCFDDVQSKC